MLKLEGDPKEYTHEELFNIYKTSYELVVEPILAKIGSYANLEKVNRIMGDLSYVDVVLRNYKGWFMDIVDLDIYDSEGDSISIDYPEYEYNIENYEEEVKRSIAKYLKNKYGVEEGSYEIEPNWQLTETDDD